MLAPTTPYVLDIYGQICKYSIRKWNPSPYVNISMPCRPSDRKSLFHLELMGKKLTQLKYSNSLDINWYNDMIRDKLLITIKVVSNELWEKGYEF